MSFAFSKLMRLAVAALMLLVAPSAALADTPLSATLTFDSLSGEISVEYAEGAAHVPAAKWLHKTPTQNLFKGKMPALDDTLKTAAWSGDASYIAGDNWLPKEHVADHDITVVVNATDQVAVTGRIVENRVSGSSRHLRFTFSGPSDQIIILIGQYEVAERQLGALTLRTYFDADNAALADRYLAATETYIRHFEAQIGPFPYDSYAVVSAPIPVGLGFAGLTYVGRDLLAHDYMSQRSLAHEILHSWWGNAVRVDYAAGNWSEGLTTYLADYAIEAAGDPQKEAAMRRGWIRDLDALDPSAMSSLRDFVAASHTQNQSIGYGKAAMVFHLLRQKLGDNVFLAALAGFYQDQHGKQAGWDDLQAAFETASGHDLEWFFDQWVDQAGLPTLTIKSATPTNTGAELVLRQSAPAYTMTVPVMIETHHGITHHTLTMTEQEQLFEITSPAPIRSLQVDPDFHMLRHPAAKELAPTLALAFNTDDFNASLAVATPADGATLRQSLANMLPDHNLIWEGHSNPALSRMVVGTTEQVAAVAAEHFGQVSDVAREGAARAWVDYDAEGRMWFFLSADDPEKLQDDMAYLGYYSSRGFVVFENGRGKRSGTPQAKFAPLLRRFD